MPSLQQARGRGNEPLFPLGRTLITSGAKAALTEDEVFSALNRHERGDWGDLETGDLQANDQALESGGRIFSAYHSAGRVKFYVITEHDRSSTTILLPQEY